MKWTTVWILTALLLAAAVPAGAGGPYVADLNSTSGPVVCGRIQVADSLILVDLDVTGLCKPSALPSAPNIFALCAAHAFGGSTFVANLVDSHPPFGRIVGIEAILKGAADAPFDAAHFEVRTSDGDCSGNLEWYSGVTRF